jgi:hypothetical protein
MFDENQRVADELGLISAYDLDAAQWAALDNFFTKRTWWKRVWIIQEIAFARDVWLFCGSKCMHWATFHDLWRQESCNTNYHLH